MPGLKVNITAAHLKNDTLRADHCECRALKPCRSSLHRRKSPVSHRSFYPSVVFFRVRVFISLVDYQRKVTNRRRMVSIGWLFSPPDPVRFAAFGGTEPIAEGDLFAFWIAYILLRICKPAMLLLLAACPLLAKLFRCRATDCQLRMFFFAYSISVARSLTVQTTTG